jgi:hypothetical protein
MTSWFLLFVVQAALIARHRLALHRCLGIAGAFLAAAIVIRNAHRIAIFA